MALSSTAPGGKTKVAVLGGGCGGLAAAFWLTSTAALRDRFEVTVYTRGWRLGGKGASGRNASRANRIEEHGLHMWMGCYENAFRTLRACFDEWNPPDESPFQTWSDAFAPQCSITVTQRDQGTPPSAWQLWRFKLPERDGTPGDGKDLPLVDSVLRFADWIAMHRPEKGAATSPALAAQGGVAVAWWRRAAASALLGAIQVVTWALMASRVLARIVLAVLRALGAVRSACWVPIVFDLVMAMAIGIATDIIPFGRRGFDRINALDFRDWLMRHGAMRTTVDCAVVRALYDLAFAYPGGDASDPAKGQGATGAALRFLMELGLSYKGAPLWKMNAGMGDTVFTPLYQVLLDRKVRFSFFHQVSDIGLSGDQRSVQTITLKRQADLKSSPYAPLVRVGGLQCWPNEPLWDQLADGSGRDGDGWRFESIWDSPCVGEDTLVAGHDFDAVVLAFPPEMIRLVAPALSAHNAEWERMIEQSSSVATQAFQLWLQPTLTGLGWNHGPAVLSAYAPPFDTWADMTHLLTREDWKGDVPHTIAYFCGALAQPPILPRHSIKAVTARVERSARSWLTSNAQVIWPALPGVKSGVPRNPIISDYFRCNVDPSERYVQSLPGSVQYRLTPGACVYENLFIAGDWTTTRYNSGCVEAAVESGMLAAQALGAGPIPIYGQG